MKWAVEIQKTNLEQSNLADLLNGLGFTLISGVKFLALTSPEIDSCHTVESVFEKAKQLRTAFTGVAKIDPEFELGAVIDYSFDPPKRHVFLEAKPIMAQTYFGSVAITVSPPKGLSSNELERWKKEHNEHEYQAKLEKQRARLEPVFWCTTAAKVLELLSIVNPSGEAIYKIYELVENDHNSRQAFHTKFGILKNQFDRFRDAVHNPAVTGDWARHALKDTPRTNHPMTKEEAESFIRQIADKWLNNIRTSRTTGT